MNKTLHYTVAALAWFAVVAQLVLALQNRTTDITEALLRFFTFFTILTNLLVAVMFTVLALAKNIKPAVLTAVTVYITIVGVVYQLALRHVWHPRGLQRVVDELLHTVIPLLSILYWIFFKPKAKLSWANLLYFLAYPLAYLIVILVRGAVSGYYPYYFIDVQMQGWPKSLASMGIIMAAILLFSGVFIGVNNKGARR